MWYRFEDLHSRWATQENPHALRGQGGTAGDGLKGAPAIKDLGDGETATLFDIEGPGLIRRLWMTTHARDPHSLRNQILRIYWEGHDRPSVEAPLADFFGMAHGAPVPMYS